MRKVIYADAIGNLPLFRWAADSDSSARRAYPLAARVLARRYHLPVQRAVLVAALAGFATGDGE